jgi:endoglucanase
MQPPEMDFARSRRTRMLRHSRPQGTAAITVAVLCALAAFFLLAWGTTKDAGAATQGSASSKGAGAERSVSLRRQVAVRTRGIPPGPLEGGGYLGMGTRSKAVRSIQRTLTAVGFATADDGVFGPGTGAAVTRFQRAHGLAVDGVVGRQTRAGLEAVGARPASCRPGRRSSGCGLDERQSALGAGGRGEAPRGATDSGRRALGAGGARAQAPGANDPNPLLGQRWYVDWTDQPSAKAFRSFKARGMAREAALMQKIASQPIFRWIGRFDENGERAARRFLDRAAREQPGTVPGITVLNHVGESCKRGYGAGGAREDSRYRRWMEDFVRGVGSRRVIIAFEPDSLGTLKCLAPRRRASRLNNMRYGVDLLSRLPNATVYIEAGASDWRPVDEMARYLRAVGVDRVRGFMLNVTHFDTTRNNVRYGLRLSRKVGGKHFVINTDENGNGHLRYRRYSDRARRQFRSVHVWCNPKNSALGEAPTTRTAHPKVDAYLWISRPGASAGPCRGWNPRYSMRGGPNAGGFYTDRALMLASRAKF